jgi:type IV pilus assembly protein PilY1
MLPNLRNMISAKANTSHSIFGVDGSPVVRDVYYDGTWRTLLLAGMGRGGHGYFALDVTNPDAPSFLYAFSHDPTNQEVSHWDSAGVRTKLGYAGGIPAEYDYSKLGEAWSTPLITAMPYLNGRKWVAVIGGGYNAGVNTNYGSAIYVIDLEDEGKVLKRIDLTNTSGNIANAVPATLMAITPDTTSAADYKGALVYFADLESKLWKLNLTDQGTLYEITQVFDGQGTQENGRFSFHQVEASLDQNKTLWLYYGTGDYQKLQRTDSQIQNRFFAIKDKEFPKFKVANSPGNLSSLKNTSTAGGVCPSVADLGWYINLSTNEKITGKIAVSNEVVFASRYTPNNSNACSPGTSSISEHNYICGNNGSSTNLGAGVATGVVVHKGKLYVGIGGTQQSTSSLPAGWSKKGNIVQGIPKSGAWNKGTVNVESWREVW